MAVTGAIHPDETLVEAENTKNKETHEIVSIKLGVGEKKTDATEEELEHLKPYTKEVDTVAKIIDNLRKKTAEIPEIPYAPEHEMEDIYTRTLTQNELPWLLTKPKSTGLEKALNFLRPKDTPTKTDLVMISPLGKGKIEVRTTVNELINVIKKEGGNETIDGEGIQTSVVEKGDTLIIKTFTPKGTQIEYTIQI